MLIYLCAPTYGSSMAPEQNLGSLDNSHHREANDADDCKIVERRKGDAEGLPDCRDLHDQDDDHQLPC